MDGGNDRKNWQHVPTCRQVPHTRFLVDYFLQIPNNVSAFFLTHWHYDHYRGLGSHFQQGPIYCSPTTARLLERITLVDSQWIVPKRNLEPFLVEQVQVTFMDANHCPGSVMILFQTPEGSNYLHTGDMRYTSEWKKELTVLNNICLDAVYLDTTYCHRKYRFPRQDQAIQRIVDIVQNTIKDEDSNENICTSRNTLYLIATYGIGKERIIDALVQRGYRMYTSPDKWQVLQCIEYWDSCPFHSSFTTDPSASPIWLVGWNRVTESVPGRLLCNFEALEEMLYMANKSRTHSNPCLGDMPLQRVVALVPTGWTWQKHGGEYFQEKDHSRLCVYGIPYSEHSNYEELYDFVAWLRPKQVIPTVTFSKTPTKHPFHHLLAATQVKRTFLQNWLSKPQQPSDNKHPMKCDEEQSQSKLAKKCDILSYFSTSSNH